MLSAVSCDFDQRFPNEIYIREGEKRPKDFMENVIYMYKTYGIQKGNVVLG